MHLVFLSENCIDFQVYCVFWKSGLQQGHPYAEVICSLVESPQFAFPKYYSNHKVPPGMGGPFIWVQSKVELEALAVLLNNETEIGVDMEHHSVRSFRGFTALVQVCYTFILAEKMLQSLNITRS